MSLDNYLIILKYANYFGLIIVFITTIGISILASKIDNQKKEKINQLEQQVINTKRGVTSFYDYNGAHRQTYGGTINAIFGHETEIFNKMVELEKSKQFSDLVILCENQIKETPEWLTPYLYLGVAYANLGRKQEAIHKFEYVIEKAGDDPNYLEAKDLLNKLLAK